VSRKVKGREKGQEKEKEKGEEKEKTKGKAKEKEGKKAKAKPTQSKTKITHDKTPSSKADLFTDREMQHSTDEEQ
jgi:hypothetical protein